MSGVTYLINKFLPEKIRKSLLTSLWLCNLHSLGYFKWSHIGCLALELIFVSWVKNYKLQKNEIWLVNSVLVGKLTGLHVYVNGFF